MIVVADCFNHLSIVWSVFYNYKLSLCDHISTLLTAHENVTVSIALMIIIVYIVNPFLL